MTEARLPWPPRELSPNARVHHMAKYKAAKAYRETCYWTCYGKLPAIDGDGEIMLGVTFLPPDARRRDLDNMLASAKAGLDAVADVLAVNDYRFSLVLRRGEPVADGAVVVTIG